MAQSNRMADVADEQNDEAAREQMRTTHGHERRELDVADDDHPLDGMDSERQAPIESVAKNVVRRYDVTKAAIREYLANAHTACIQRAKWMLAEHGDISDVDMTSVRDVLDAAKEQFGYEPVITVKRNKNPNARWSLKILDNGIGVDSKTAYAIRDIGLSGWHMDGSTNGQFGQGTMAGFLLSGLYGEFHMTTMSAVTGENYRAAWKLTDLNRLNGDRDGVGTTFTWPTLDDDAEDIEMYDAVREYAEGMVIPVIYEEYDENGNETHNSDEFLPAFMEDRYPDDALVITYEDDFGKAVWSPSDPDSWNTNVNTFCGYQPIDRNERGYSLNSYEMPSAFDFRLKVEDGSIIEVDGEMDHELVGKTPVSRQKYRSMLLSERSVVPNSYAVDNTDKRGFLTDDGQMVVADPDRAQQMGDVQHDPDADEHTPAIVAGKYAGRLIVSDDEWASMDAGRVGDEFVPRDEIPDDLDVLQSMEPTDDRDRFERKHVQDVLRRYSNKLWDQLRQKTADSFESVNEFEDIFDLDGNEQALFHKGVTRFGPNFKRSDPETIQEELDDEIGVEIPIEVCEKIGVMKKEVSLAPRGCNRPQRKGYRQEKPVWKVIRLAQDGDSDGTVYMGWRISEQKARLAWELDEANQVVQTTRRDLFEQRLGWKHLSDLPTKNFEKHFDADFDDSFLDSWDKSRTDDSSSSSAGSGGMDDDVKQLSYNDERARKRDVPVRSSTGYSGAIRQITGGDLYDGLDDASETVSWKRYDIESLVLYRQTEHNKGAGKHLVDKSSGVFYAVVPNYVYDYLIDANNAYTEDEYLDSLTDEWLDFDWTDTMRSGRTFEAADERDVIVMMNDESDLDPFEQYDEMDSFRDELESKLQSVGRLDHGQSIRSITYRESLSEYHNLLHDDGVYEFDADEARPSLVSFTTGTGYGFPTDGSFGRKSLFFDCVLGDLDRTAPEWSRFDVAVEDDEMIATMRRLQDAGGFVSTDDEEVNVPGDERLRLDKRRFGDVDHCMDDVYVTKTLERIEEAGGFPTDDDAE